MTEPKTSSQRRVFILGIDGASWNTLDPQMQAGRMPALKAFLDGAARCDLQSVVPPITPAAWSTFHSGKEPRKHGVLDFRGYDPVKGRLWFNSFKQIRAKTMWQILSEHGRRVGVVHVPMMFPAPKVNGVVVGGFETPSVESAFCHPPELRQRILEWFPDYLFGPDRVARDSAANIAALLEAGRKGLRQRAELVERLHADDRFDVFMVNFQEFDWLLHKIYLFVAHDDDPLLCPKLLGEVRAFIETLDECIGRVLRPAQDYDVRLVVSDHGFTREIGAVHPNVALEAWGYYVRKPAEELEPGGALRRLLRGMERSSFKPARALAGAVRGWRRTGSKAWVVDQQTVSATDVEFDLSRTRAVVVASDMSGLLYLNRHASGPLANASKDKLATLRRELAERFRSLHNPVTGAPMFREVLDGAPDDDDSFAYPDLILTPVDGIKALSTWSYLSKHAPMVVFVAKVDCCGTHRPAGLLAAHGQGITSDAFREPCRLVDLAPTVLTLAGVAVPDDLDGRAISAITGTAKTVFSPASADDTDDEVQAGAYSEEEQAAVEERLRALGYLE